MAVASFFGVSGKAALACIALAIPCVAISGSIQKFTGTTTILPIGSDVDSSRTGNSESLVKRDFGGGTWTSSALAESDGNLEVGVSATRSLFTGKADADSSLFLDQRFEKGDPRIGGVRFTVQPGEILFSGFPGDFDGVLDIALGASINKVLVNEYVFRLEVKKTNTGIDINSGSTDTALVHLSEVLSGSGGLFGVRTAGFTDVLIITPAIFPGDLVSISYSMDARTDLNPLDGNFIFSAKLGDPLDTLGGGALSFIPPPIPEPSSAWQMVIGLCAFTVLGRRLRGHRRTLRGP